MLNPVETFRASLDSFVSPTDDVLILRPGAARALDAMGIGNYMHIVLRAPGRTEVMKYTHTANYDDKSRPDELAVERQDCCRVSFAPCDCVEFIWLAEDILVLVQQSTAEEA